MAVLQNIQVVWQVLTHKLIYCCCWFSSLIRLPWFARFLFWKFIKFIWCSASSSFSDTPSFLETGSTTSKSRGEHQDLWIIPVVFICLLVLEHLSVGVLIWQDKTALRVHNVGAHIVIFIESLVIRFWKKVLYSEFLTTLWKEKQFVIVLKASVLILLHLCEKELELNKAEAKYCHCRKFLQPNRPQNLWKGHFISTLFVSQQLSALITCPAVRHSS